MFKDFREAWIIYQYYKKGKMEMDKVKEFAKKHKNELLVITGVLVGYRIGFKTSQRSIDKIFEAAAKSLSKQFETGRF